MSGVCVAILAGLVVGLAAVILWPWKTHHATTPRETTPWEELSAEDRTFLGRWSGNGRPEE